MARPGDAMAGFRFHGWLIVEIFTDAGHVGIGNGALAPRVTKQTIDVYLKPLLMGADPWDVDYIQFDTNRVGGISQARKICALAEAFQVPVVPHAA